MTGKAFFKTLEAPEQPPIPREAVLDAIPWDRDGLIPAIAQQHDSGEVLMLAWMNRTALDESLSSGQAVYWSRSRGRLWRKGEESGNSQRLVSAALDCDGDALVLRVEQRGPACHSGRHSCFYLEILSDPATVSSEPEQDPALMYASKPKPLS